MIREICRDEVFLSQKAAPAAPEDRQMAEDLLETLEHHKDGCVGMAANMIGVSKRIIAFDNDGTYMVMFNPEIVKKSGPYHGRGGLSFSLPAPARPSGGSLSRCAARTRRFRCGSKPLPAGPRKSSSTRSTTVTAFSSETAKAGGKTAGLCRYLFAVTAPSARRCHSRKRADLRWTCPR